MSFRQEILLEVIRTVSSLLVAVLTLGLTWGVGNALSSRWAIRQKRRELELSAAQKFYDLYGEFFALWKLWNKKEYKDAAIPSGGQVDPELLKRIYNAEAGVEALLVKLASERTMSEEQTEILGQFRQAYQTLRETISRNERISWNSSLPKHHPDYAMFKYLACRIALMLASDTHFSAPSTEEATRNLLKITSNHWEPRNVGWIDQAQVRDLSEWYEGWISSKVKK